MRAFLLILSFVFVLPAQFAAAHEWPRTPSVVRCQDKLSSFHDPQTGRYYERARALIRPDSRPTLSIVIPAYREEARIADSIRQLKAFFNEYPFPVEILIRIEKSPDATVRVAEQAVAGDPRFALADHGVQRGKGYAVRQGMLEARGDYILYMDADLSTSLSEIFHFLSLVADHQVSDVVIGDRRALGARIASQSGARQFMGVAFQKIVGKVLGSCGLPDLHDTQCGFKMFSRAAAQSLFGQAHVDGFAFDLEILLLASQLGLEIDAVPVVWQDDARSTVRPLRDPLLMLRDVIQMRHELQQRERRTGSDG